MKTLTNESKLIFLSQNVGNQVMYEDGIYIFNGICLEEYVIQVDLKDGDTDWWHIDKAKLIKTPLQNISDEHAIEVAKLAFGLENHNYPVSDYKVIKGPKTHIVEIQNDWYWQAIRIGLEYGNVWSTTVKDHEASKQRAYNQVAISQYFLSKGYAIPFYCPIENRIIPVQEQIDNGWITLKTQ